MKVYDFEWEQTIEWARKVQKDIDAFIPKNTSSKHKTTVEDVCFTKLEKFKWPIGRLCKKCNKRELQVGQKSYCVDCTRIGNANDEYAMFYGY